MNVRLMFVHLFT